MAASRKIFIDASFFIAFVDRADLNHRRSIALFEYLAKNQYQVYTSSQIVFLTFSRMEKDMGSIVALEFLQAILESNINILFPAKTDMGSVVRFLKINKTTRASVNQLVNSILMEKNGIISVLTFDLWHNLMGTRKSDLLN